MGHNASGHASVYLGPNVRLGHNVEIGPLAYIDGNVSIGDGARVMGGVFLRGDLEIGPGCCIEPRVAITLAAGAFADGRIVLEEGVHLGAGSVLAPGVRIRRGARIAAGTVVNQDVPPYAIVSGNPAAIRGYVESDTRGPVSPARRFADGATAVQGCSVAGVTIHYLPRSQDMRGALSVGEFPKDIPFEPKRYFVVFDVPTAKTRGEHAHIACKEFLICVRGSLSVIVDDGTNSEEIVLDHPSLGLYIPPNIWALQHQFSRDAVLLVFCSDIYESDDYIRSYANFLAARSDSGLKP